MNIDAESLGEIELAVICAVLGAIASTLVTWGLEHMKESIKKEVLPDEAPKSWISFSCLSRTT